MVPSPETLSDLDFSASALREASLQAVRHFIQPAQGIAFVLISKANVDLVFIARVWTTFQKPPGHSKHFTKEFEIRLPQLFDPEETGFPVSEAYGIDMAPATFLIDENKRIMHVSVAWDRAEFATMASALVSVAGLSKLKLFEPVEYVDDFPTDCAGKN